MYKRCLPSTASIELICSYLDRYLLNPMEYFQDISLVWSFKKTIQRAAKLGELMAYKHEGFWQCMDTKRDYKLLEELWKNNPPWVL